MSVIRRLRCDIIPDISKSVGLYYLSLKIVYFQKRFPATLANSLVHKHCEAKITNKYDPVPKVPSNGVEFNPLF